MINFKRPTKNRSICFVASTLPAGFISARARELSIVKIVVMSSNLEISYNSIKLKHPSIEIVLAPRGWLAQCINFFFTLLVARLRGFRIIIFHECCVTHLDLMIMLVRPRGNYFPLSTMLEWEEISFSQFKKNKITSLIKFLKLENKFTYYRTPDVVNNYKLEYAISIKKYPQSIIEMDLSFTRDIASLAARKKIINTKNILFITGKSYVQDNAQIKLYLELMDLAQSMGYTFSLKDHPNPSYRLNIHHEYALLLNPFTPVELYEDDFDIVVGVSSTALLAYGDRAVSLLKMIPEMAATDRDACIRSYEILSTSGSKIRYVLSTNDFISILNDVP
jgi:hypothetical protein